MVLLMPVRDVIELVPVGTMLARLDAAEGSRSLRG